MRGGYQIWRKFATSLTLSDYYASISGMKRIVLTPEKEERLDIALAHALNISRAQAQRLIKEGLISVEGKVLNAHALIKPDTEATLKEALVPEVQKPEEPLPPLEILFENEDVIVVNKPSGLLVHQAPGEVSRTLHESLLAHAPEMKKAGEDEGRAGIVHRLDKEASGVLIAAKNGTAFRHLKLQFSERQTEKHYTVLVMGNVKDDVGTIRFPIARSSTRARMAARALNQEGKEAITHFTVKERYTTCTLLDVKIETGRTHQIRAHFFAIGHPVAGDKLYNRKDIKPLAIPRLFLHARSLTITLPSGERSTFEAPLPKELEETLISLKKKV